MPKDFLQGASLTPTFIQHFKCGELHIFHIRLMLKNAFKKHPLQNRTNVQIKGGGGQRPFEQCSKKLHFSERRASLINVDVISWPWDRDCNSDIDGWLLRRRGGWGIAMIGQAGRGQRSHICWDWWTRPTSPLPQSNMGNTKQSEECPNVILTSANKPSLPLTTM